MRCLQNCWKSRNLAGPWGMTPIVASATIRKIRKQKSILGTIEFSDTQFLCNLRSSSKRKIYISCAPWFTHRSTSNSSTLGCCHRNTLCVYDHACWKKQQKQPETWPLPHFHVPSLVQMDLLARTHITFGTLTAEECRTCSFFAVQPVSTGGYIERRVE